VPQPPPDAPRWRGQRGRLEVWYATLTHPASGTGLWLHHEIVAPRDAAPFSHGWAALFPIGRAPVVERFGPFTATRGDRPELLHGKAGALTWDLTVDGDGGRSLYTFPQWAWEREVLPGAQVVPSPAATFTGRLQLGDDELDLDGSRGAVAHIYGHGNAERWGWLHADLGGDDVLEIVAAKPRRPGLTWLPPLPLVQLRTGGRDWPRDPLAAAPLFRARLGLPAWRVRGFVGRRRLRVDVVIPAAESVAVDYADPDGAPAVCTNSERADADVVVERFDGRWRTEHSWSLRSTAHAEIGTRP
jgi:hypothetical protein